MGDMMIEALLAGWDLLINEAVGVKVGWTWPTGHTVV